MKNHLQPNSSQLEIKWKHFKVSGTSCSSSGSTLETTCSSSGPKWDRLQGSGTSRSPSGPTSEATCIPSVHKWDHLKSPLYIFTWLVGRQPSKSVPQHLSVLVGHIYKIINLREVTYWKIPALCLLGTKCKLKLKKNKKT